LGEKEFQLQGVKVFAAKEMFATKAQRREEDLTENLKIAGWNSLMIERDQIN